MANISTYSDHYGQEVEREGRYFDNLRSLAENEFAEPGEEFYLDLELVPATDYYGDERAVLVREGISTLGILPPEDLDEWWPLLCAMADAEEDIEVSGRIWTCPDWDTRFYASVQLNMPSVDDALAALEDDFVELTPENLEAHKTFTNFVVEHWDERWRKAHDMSDEETEQIHLETRQRLIDSGALDPDGSVPDRRPSLAPTPTAQVSTAIPSSSEWALLLTPDGTPRANMFQRGYVRGTIGKHFENRAPRIDYATVGQCERILARFGEPADEIKKRGSFVLKALWWLLLALLALVGLIALVVGAWPLTLIIASPFVYHYITRARLQAPFDKQQ